MLDRCRRDHGALGDRTCVRTVSNTGIHRNLDVTPVSKTSHCSRRTIVLRYPTRAYQSDTTVVDQRPLRHQHCHRSNESRPENRGGFHLPMEKTCLHISSMVLLSKVCKVEGSRQYPPQCYGADVLPLNVFEVFLVV